jgi:beta-N-acetylhexosaminidase
MNLDFLRRAPFRLNRADLEKVENLFLSLSMRERLAQLLVPLAVDTTPANLERHAATGVGGLFRFCNRPESYLRAEAELLRRECRVPPLLCGDLEFGEGSTIGGDDGTAFPNPLAASAAGLFAVERQATIAGVEGRAAGFNWSLSPVADLDFNRQNTVVSTRSFGDKPAWVARCVQTYVRSLQREGVAACAKHWPGDGAGAFDQHHTLGVNPLSRADWERTYGKVFRAAIREGVMSVMSAHIALPCFSKAGRQPASLSHFLNHELLRKTLGFNGLIVSDASSMAGLTLHEPRENLVPHVISAGCDMLLFPVDPEYDLELLVRALEQRRLTAERANEAVCRVLGMKAALGLLKTAKQIRPLTAQQRSRHARWARETAEKSVTLVRDRKRMLPLNPRRQRRLLLIEPKERHGWTGPLPPLQMESLLRIAGFEVTRFVEAQEIRPEDFDAAIWVTADEARAGRESLTMPWSTLLGRFPVSMMRTWPEIPSVFISLGHPWQACEVDGCHAVINAYSPVAAVQEAVVKCLVGRLPFNGVGPVTLPRETRAGR